MRRARGTVLCVVCARWGRPASGSGRRRRIRAVRRAGRSLGARPSRHARVARGYRKADGGLRQRASGAAWGVPRAGSTPSDGSMGPGDRARARAGAGGCWFRSASRGARTTPRAGSTRRRSSWKGPGGGSRSRRSTHVTLFAPELPVRTVRVVVGKPSTPTPVGLFAVVWAIPWHANDFLGSWVLELTAHSDVLQHFEGGEGRSVYTAAGERASGPARLRGQPRMRPPGERRHRLAGRQGRRKCNCPARRCRSNDWPPWSAIRRTAPVNPPPAARQLGPGASLLGPGARGPGACGHATLAPAVRSALVSARRSAARPRGARRVQSRGSP